MGFNISENKRREIYNMTSGKCFYCGMELNFKDFHVDHFIAKSNGGKDKNNRVPACPDCNLIKSDKSLDEFRKEIEEAINKNARSRTIAKYYKLKPRKILFYFEKMKF